MRINAIVGAILLVCGTTLAAQTTRPASPLTLLGEAPQSQPDPDAVARRQADLKVVERMIEQVRDAATVDAAARAAILKMWQDRRPDDDPRSMMTAAVALMSPPYKAAMDALDAGKHADAVAALKPLGESKDFHISTYAAALTARALVEQDQTEEAIKLLEKLADQQKELDSRTLLGCEIKFMLGFCRVSNLQFDQALATLKEFERLYPEAPDQYRLPARQMLQELTARQPGSLGEVSDLMSYAGRQLKHARTGEVVTSRQDQAVQLLGRLISDAEEQENQNQQSGSCKQCGGKGCPACKGTGRALGNQQQPQFGANRSVLPPGQGRIGDLRQSVRARPGEEWGKMRPEERERIMQALRQSFPSRYRQLVEQYYRELAKQE